MNIEFRGCRAAKMCQNRSDELGASCQIRNKHIVDRDQGRYEVPIRSRREAVNDLIVKSSRASGYVCVYM